MTAQEAAHGPAAPRRRRTSSTSGGTASGGPSRQLSAEDSAELAALATAPLEDASNVAKTVAWLERCCFGSGGAGDGRGGPVAAGSEEEEEGEGLREVLLPLVIGLRRMDQLGAAMKELKQSNASRLKDLLR